MLIQALLQPFLAGVLAHDQMALAWGGSKNHW